ncbi:MAG: hypothetical protein J5642_06270 [Bacteroidales bacterium]|nr:hypothetical protein [Bacteroidales bacterium]
MTDQLFQKFSTSTVLVIGDLMIDAYLNGSVGRISPEAPVPIVDIKERTYRPGGAANVALNISSLGGTPLLCSLTGEDEKGQLFRQLMDEHGIPTRHILPSPDRKTTVKYRVIGNRRQMLRIDDESLHPLTPREHSLLMENIREIFQHSKIHAVIFEDYDKGVITPELIGEVVALARSQGIPVTVDPKKRNFSQYKNVTLFKPNLKELLEGTSTPPTEFQPELVHSLMKQLAQKQEIEHVFTTLSEHGVALYDHSQDTFQTEPAYLRKISDVSGAGDTVIAVATLCLAAGLPLHSVCQIANLAGGIVCEYQGVTPIPKQQLHEEIQRHHLLDS